MANDKDVALFEFVAKQTELGALTWEPTAWPDQFTTSIKGKYNITVDKSQKGSYWMTLLDASGRQLLVIRDDELNVEYLYNKAARASLNVDQVIDEILKDDDIPF